MNAAMFIMASVPTLLFVYGVISGTGAEQYIEAHPTLVSPDAELSKLIWVVIFASQLLFVVTQMVPWCRQATAVVTISQWYWVACGLQVLVVIFRAFDTLFIVACLNAGILTCLVAIVVILDSKPRLNLFELILMRLPFSIWAGWALVMTAESFNAFWAVGNDWFAYDLGQQLSIAVTTVGTVVCIMTGMAIAVPRPDPLLCASVAVSFWVAGQRLQRIHTENSYVDPPQEKFPFTPVVIDSFARVNFMTAFLAACYAILAVFLRVYQRFFMREQGQSLIVIRTN